MTTRASSTALQLLLRSSLIPATALLTYHQCSSSPNICSHNNKLRCEQTEPNRFFSSLIQHRSQLSAYKEKWDYNNLTSRIPTTSWPLNIPSDSTLPSLQFELRFCSRSPNYRDASTYCNELQFRIAYALILNNDPSGLKLLKELAEQGHPDSMCGYGMCLMEGRVGVDPNPKQAVGWFRRCEEMFEHPQAMYELGVALYTGEGVVENERQAVKYFRKAAEMNHPAAAFMLGDCLLDGNGVERDRAKALEWLVRAGEMGHRGARSRVLAVLEKEDGKDYGGFTDSSMMTFKKHRETRFNKEESVRQHQQDDRDLKDDSDSDEVLDEEEMLERELEERLQWSAKAVTLTERRFTRSTPAVLAKRRTKVQESRVV